jgi:hypothetical protein
LKSGNLVKVVEQADGVVILEARYGGRTLEVAANVSMEGKTLFLRQTHIQGAAPGQVGIKGLYDLIRDLGKANEATEVVVEGGRRTTGIGKIKGNIPSPIRVKVDK